MKIRLLILAIVLCMAVYLGGNALAQEKFEAFKPVPTSEKTVNYDVWSKILNGIVVYTGPSTRHRMRDPLGAKGTSLKVGLGSFSRYRMDGNRVIFSQFSDGWKLAIHQYAKDLELIANEIEVTSLPKNEQLAFWFNLHNATMIDRISQNYPIKYPERFVPAGQELTLHDAKVLNIHGIPLSLRDIRENIVYANWPNPVVIYGFFLGDMGSPSIRKIAYTGENVQTLLNFSAREFTSSLRGIHLWDEDVRISKIYLDVRRFYFPDYEADLRAHLKKYMSEGLQPKLLKTPEFIYMPYPYDVADLAGGSTIKTKSSVAVFKSGLEKKFKTLKRQGKVKRGEVIIEDIPKER